MKGRVWRGEDDLSAACWLTWDCAGLYVDIKAKDDIHIPNSNADQGNSGDSVTITIIENPMPVLEVRDTSNGMPHCLRICSGTRGQVFECSSPLRPSGPTRTLPGGRAIVRREDNSRITEYHIYIPWASIWTSNREVCTGLRLGLAISIEDDDGAGVGSMHWLPQHTFGLIELS